MATTRDKYVAKCNEIVDAKPAYKHGASDLKECDCIGMDKYSFRENGMKFSTTGTNYSARNQLDNFRKIASASDLKYGDVVLKAYEPGESGWDLPAKYQQGGSAYNGDLRDYYHIGTVRSTNPLEIIHMTSPTAKVDTKIGKWGYTGSWKKEYISDDAPGPEPTPPQPEPPTPTDEWATVYAPTGMTVNIRKKPSKNSALVERVPIGEMVRVLEHTNDEWCKVEYKDPYRATWRGYMMTEFLIFDTPQPEPGSDLYTVLIEHLNKDMAEQIKAQYPTAVIMAEDGAVG